jgi:hypothetical protein
MLSSSWRGAHSVTSWAECLALVVVLHVFVSGVVFTFSAEAPYIVVAAGSEGVTLAWVSPDPLTRAGLRSKEASIWRWQ